MGKSVTRTLDSVPLIVMDPLVGTVRFPISVETCSRNLVSSVEGEYSWRVT